MIFFFPFFKFLPSSHPPGKKKGKERIRSTDFPFLIILPFISQPLASFHSFLTSYKSGALRIGASPSLCFTFPRQGRSSPFRSDKESFPSALSSSFQKNNNNNSTLNHSDPLTAFVFSFASFPSLRSITLNWFLRFPSILGKTLQHHFTSILSTAHRPTPSPSSASSLSFQAIQFARLVQFGLPTRTKTFGP